MARQNLDESIRFGPAPAGIHPDVARRFDTLDRQVAGIVDLLTARERTVRFQFSGNADGAGNATLEIRQALSEGYEFSLHRVIVDDGTGTFAAQTTGGSVEIRVNGVRVDGAPLTAGSTPGGLPCVFTASSSAGIFIRGGDKLEVVLIGCGAVSKRVFGVAQGKLRRVPLGE